MVKNKSLRFILFALTFTILASCSKGVSSKFESGKTYVYFGSSECIDGVAGDKCVSKEDAKALCKAVNGFTYRLTSGLTGGLWGSKVQALFEGGDVDSIKTSWNGKTCEASITASGIYLGSSARATYTGEIQLFFIDKSRNVLAHYINGSAL